MPYWDEPHNGLFFRFVRPAGRTTSQPISLDWTSAYPDTLCLEAEIKPLKCKKAAALIERQQLISQHWKNFREPGFNTFRR